MTKGTMIFLAAAGCVGIFLLIVVCWWVSTSNGEIRLRNAIVAK